MSAVDEGDGVERLAGCRARRSGRPSGGSDLDGLLDAGGQGAGGGLPAGDGEPGADQPGDAEPDAGGDGPQRGVLPGEPAIGRVEDRARRRRRCWRRPTPCAGSCGRRAPRACRSRPRRSSRWSHGRGCRVPCVRFTAQNVPAPGRRVRRRRSGPTASAPLWLCPTSPTGRARAALALARPGPCAGAGGAAAEPPGARRPGPGRTGVGRTRSRWRPPSASWPITAQLTRKATMQRPALPAIAAGFQRAATPAIQPRGRDRGRAGSRCPDAREEGRGEPGDGRSAARGARRGRRRGAGEGVSLMGRLSGPKVRTGSERGGESVRSSEGDDPSRPPTTRSTTPSGPPSPPSTPRWAEVRGTARRYPSDVCVFTGVDVLDDAGLGRPGRAGRARRRGRRCSGRRCPSRRPAGRCTTAAAATRWWSPPPRSSRPSPPSTSRSFAGSRWPTSARPWPSSSSPGPGPSASAPSRWVATGATSTPTTGCWRWPASGCTSPATPRSRRSAPTPTPGAGAWPPTSPAAWPSAILERGETPFLHVAEGNDAALRVYERLGFRRRRTVEFAFVESPPPADLALPRPAVSASGLRERTAPPRVSSVNELTWRTREDAMRDAVIIDAVRTPLGKGKATGALAGGAPRRPAGHAAGRARPSAPTSTRR